MACKRCGEPHCDVHFDGYDESVDEDEETEEEEESDTEEAEDVEEDDNPDTEEAEEMEEDDDKHSVSGPWTFLLNCSNASIRKASL